MYKAIVNDKPLEVLLDKDQLIVDENVLDWDLSKIDKHSFHVLKNNKSYRVEILSLNQEDKTVTLRINGNKYHVNVKDKMDLLLEKLGMDKLISSQLKDIKAPMPGLILDILVNEGDEVKKGDQIMILEAMKMENVLKSPGDGTVKTIKVKKGEGVDKNQVLILF